MCKFYFAFKYVVRLLLLKVNYSSYLSMPPKRTYSYMCSTPSCSGCICRRPGWGPCPSPPWRGVSNQQRDWTESPGPSRSAQPAWSKATEPGCAGHHIPLWLLKMLTWCLILPATQPHSGTNQDGACNNWPDLHRLSFPPMSWGWRNGSRHYRSLVLGLSTHTTKGRRPIILGSDWSTLRATQNTMVMPKLW